MGIKALEFIPSGYMFDTKFTAFASVCNMMGLYVTGKAEIDLLDNYLLQAQEKLDRKFMIPPRPSLT
jgi:hypothetical protein